MATATTTDPNPWLLSPLTNTCANNHELLPLGDPAKTNKNLNAADIVDVTSCGWCDVCNEPYEAGVQTFSCRHEECMFDSCYSCRMAGREAYIVTFEFVHGPLQGQSVYGTMTILKKFIDLSNSPITSDTIEVPNCLESLDFEMNMLNWGLDYDEKDAIYAGTGTFSKTTGKLISFSMDFEDQFYKTDLQIFGRSICKILINTKNIPEDLPDALRDSGNWIEVVTQNMSLGAGEDRIPSYGTVKFKRFGMIEFPAWDYSQDANTALTGKDASLTLLRTIAKNKHKIIDPMRNAHLKKKWINFNLFKSKNQPAILGMTFRSKVAAAKEVDNILVHVTGQTAEQLEKEANFSFEPNKGRIHRKDLIYAARLSILAYLMEPTTFNEFFPASREAYLIDPIWSNFLKTLGQNEAKSLLRQHLANLGDSERSNTLFRKAHEMFLSKFLAGFFNQIEGLDSYGKSKPLNDLVSDLGLFLHSQMHTVVDRADVEGFIAVSRSIEQNGGDICLVFQGSRELNDVFLNLNGASSPFLPLTDKESAGWFGCCREDPKGEHDVRVHLGFYNAFLSIKTHMDTSIRDLLKKIPKDKHVRIVVTGHSLGGALANITCAWLLELFSDKTGLGIADEINLTDSDRLRVVCCTFGSPKIGHEAFVDAIDKHPYVCNKDTSKIRFKILRLVDVQDPVTCLPPSGGGFSYAHTTQSGATILWDGGMTFFNGPEVRKLNPASRGVKELFFKGGNAAVYHDIFLYLHKTMHFAWAMYQKEKAKDQNWVNESDPLANVFGEDNYDEFTKEVDFLKKF